MSLCNALSHTGLLVPVEEWGGMVGNSCHRHCLHAAGTQISGACVGAIMSSSGVCAMPFHFQLLHVVLAPK